MISTKKLLLTIFSIGSIIFNAVCAAQDSFLTKDALGALNVVLVNDVSKADIKFIPIDTKPNPKDTQTKSTSAQSIAHSTHTAAKVESKSDETSDQSAVDQVNDESKSDKVKDDSASDKATSVNAKSASATNKAKDQSKSDNSKDSSTSNKGKHLDVTEAASQANNDTSKGSERYRITVHGIFTESDLDKSYSPVLSNLDTADNDEESVKDPKPDATHKQPVVSINNYNRVSTRTKALGLKKEATHVKIGKAYTINGKVYKPFASVGSFTQVGIASWYGNNFHGRKTANGERFDQNSLTAAHTILPLQSIVKVTHVSTGKSVIVRINDRGPFYKNRIIDLSYGAAKQLGIVKSGKAKVKIELIKRPKTTL